jgi:predicted naringenin-chalcone synthase
MNSHKENRIVSIGTSVPPFAATQDESFKILENHYKGKVKASSLALAKKVFAHPSVKKRHFGTDDPSELFEEDPDRRVDRFTKWAVRLSCEASRKAIETAGLTARDISAIAVNTCTGYICPGISTYVIEELGLKLDIPAYDLVGAGCGGALPNIELCSSLLNEKPGSAVLSVSVEICSAAFQMGDNISLIISNAIFGDGASACVLKGSGPGLELLDYAVIHCPQYRDDIRFVYKSGQLHNQLTSGLPKIAGTVVTELVEGLLGRNGLSVKDIKHWALHAGGENVINSLKDGLGLSEEQIRWAREVLGEYGNMSSPSAIFALKKVLESSIAPGELGIIVAFGAGMSAYAMLFKKV